MTCFGTTTHREQNSCSKQKPPYRHDTTLEREGSVMKIIDRWNEIMGPKDERLAAEANRCAAIGYTILIIGSALCLYYGIMLNQVAETTGHPLLTPLGQSVFPVDTALLIVILGSGLISTYLQVRSGAFDTHARIAQSDRIPWDYVALVALLCGLGLGITTTAMRILAEVQIVGIENVMWGGDIAIGIVYFTLAFILAFVLFAATFRSAIDRRRQLERKLEE